MEHLLRQVIYLKQLSFQETLWVLLKNCRELHMKMKWD